MCLKHPLESKKGFTIIEVIISISLISLISLSIFLLLNQSILISNVSNYRDEILTSGRFGFEYIVGEIEGADKIIDSSKFSGFNTKYPNNVGFVIYNYNENNHRLGDHEYTSYYLNKDKLLRIKCRSSNIAYPNSLFFSTESGTNYLCEYIKENNTSVNFESNIIDLSFLVGNDEFSYVLRSFYNINCESDY